jgi:hypothetical protein
MHLLSVGAADAIACLVRLQVGSVVVVLENVVGAPLCHAVLLPYLPRDEPRASRTRPLPRRVFPPHRFQRYLRYRLRAVLWLHPWPTLSIHSDASFHSCAKWVYFPITVLRLPAERGRVSEGSDRGSVDCVILQLRREETINPGGRA